MSEMSYEQIIKSLERVQQEQERIARMVEEKKQVGKGNEEEEKSPADKS